MQFPTLTKIITDTIHVPTSSAAVESLFSHVADIKTYKRSKLSGENLNDMLTLFYADLYIDSYNLTDFFKSEHKEL